MPATFTSGRSTRSIGGVTVEGSRSVQCVVFNQEGRSFRDWRPFMSLQAVCDNRIRFQWISQIPRRCRPPQKRGDSTVREAQYSVNDRSLDIEHSPDVRRAALAYLCDYTLLELILRNNGAAWADPGVITASLDHAMWWHNDGRVDEWIALVQESPFATTSPPAHLGRSQPTHRVLVTDCQLRVSGGRQSRSLFEYCRDPRRPSRLDFCLCHLGQSFQYLARCGGRGEHDFEASVVVRGLHLPVFRH